MLFIVAFLLEFLSFLGGMSYRGVMEQVRNFNRPNHHIEGSGTRLQRDRSSSSSDSDAAFVLPDDWLEDDLGEQRVATSRKRERSKDNRDRTESADRQEQ